MTNYHKNRIQNLATLSTNSLKQLQVITSQQRPSTSLALFKPITRNTLIFDGKNEKFERFEVVLKSMLKMQPQMTEAMKVNQFHLCLQKYGLQTFRKFNACKKRTLEDVLFLFRRKYVKPQSQATAEHKWYKLTFEPNTKSICDFLAEMLERAERTFEPLARQMIDSLLYATLFTHLERELELSWLETDGKSPIPTMTTTTTLNKQT